MNTPQSLQQPKGSPRVVVPAAQRSWSRYLWLALAVAFVAAGASAVLTGVDRPSTAAALDPIDCDTSQLVITASNDIRRVTTEAGSGKWTQEVLFDVSDEPTLRLINQVGINRDGSKIYATALKGDPEEPFIMEYDLASDSATFIPNPLGGGVAGAYNLFDNKYYWGGYTGKITDEDGNTSTAAVINRFDPASQAFENQLLTISLPLVTDENGDEIALGGNGDLTFSSTGDMYFVASRPDSMYIYLVTYEQLQEYLALPIADRTFIEPRVLNAQVDQGFVINGIAFGATGSLYLSGGDGIRAFDANTGVFSDVEPNIAGGSDLGSCTDPPTIELEKNIAPERGRQQDTDQFSLAVEGNGINFNNTATTEGTESGIQPQRIGPLLGFTGETYTITEAAAGTTDLVTYDTVWQCIDTGNGDALLAEGTGVTGQVTMPSVVGSKVVCTFTNTALVGIPEVLKSSDPPSGTEVKPGQVVNYTLSWDNSANVVPAVINEIDDISGVLDNATLTSGPTVNGEGIAVGEITDGAFTITGELAAGAKATVTYSVTVDDPPKDDFQLLNFLYEDGTDKPTKCEVPNPRCTNHPVPGAPAISLEKSAKVNDLDGSGSNTIGDTITYSFLVKNTGNVDLTDVVVNDPLFGDTPMVCPKDALVVGEEMICTAPSDYTLTAEDVAKGTRENTATVMGKDPEGNKVTDTDTEEVPVVGQPDIMLEKTAKVTDVDKSGGNTKGDTVNYTFKVTNTGDVALKDVVVTDPLFGTTPMTCPKTELAVDESMECTAPSTYTLTQADVDAGKRENTATVTGTDPTGTKVDDTDTAVVTVVRLPDTGSGTTNMLQFAGLLVAAGIPLTIIGRRRRYAS